MSVPTAALGHRINALQQQIDRLGADETTASGAPTMLANAHRNLLIVAGSLLEAGRDGGPNAAVAGLYGHTIANRAEAFEQYLQRFGQAVDEALDPKGSAPLDRIRQLNEAAHALKRLNRQAAASTELRDARSRSVDAYLKQMLNPLATVVSATAANKVASQWPAALRAADAQDAGPNDGPLTAERIDKLDHRVLHSPLPVATRMELTSIVQFMQDAWGDRDLRSSVRQLNRQVDRALGFGQTVRLADWLDDADRLALYQQLHEALLLIKMPGTRAAGTRKLAALRLLQPTMDQIGRLAAAEAPMEIPRRLFQRVIDPDASEAETMPVDEVRIWLGQVTSMMSAVRQLEGDDLPADLRRQFRTLRREYEQTEVRLLVSMAAMIDTLGPSHTPSWSAHAEQVVHAVSDMQRIIQVPKWSQQLEAINPRLAGGLIRRIHAMANDLTDGHRRISAAAGLDQFGHELAHVAPLPVESRIPLSPRLRHLTGNAQQRLAERAGELRSVWLTGWSRGNPSATVIERMKLMRRLLLAIEQAGAVADPQATLARLNRWPAWELDEPTVQYVAVAIDAQVIDACRAAVGQDWPNLDASLNKLEQTLGVMRLLVRLDEAIGTALADTTDEATDMISQCLFAPADRAYAAAHRLELAQLCATLTEARYADEVNGDQQLAADLLAYCGRIAHDIDVQLTDS